MTLCIRKPEPCVEDDRFVSPLVIPNGKFGPDVELKILYMISQEVPEEANGTVDKSPMKEINSVDTLVRCYVVVLVLVDLITDFLAQRNPPQEAFSNFIPVAFTF